MKDNIYIMARSYYLDYDRLPAESEQWLPPLVDHHKPPEEKQANQMQGEWVSR